MENTEKIGYAQGRTLTNIEQAALACSAPIIRRDYAGNVSFWGKVLGQQSDYLICTVSKSRFEKTWVYSVDNGLTWNPTVLLNEEQQHYCQLTKGPFKGNPKYEYKFKEELPPDPEPVVEERKEEEKDEDQEEEGDIDGEEKDDDEEPAEDKEEKEEEQQETEVQKKKPKKPKIREILIAESIRLSHFVREVDSACCVIPKNIHRGGLTVEEAFDLSNYLHNVPEGGPLSADMPQGIWAIKKDPSAGIVVCNNLFYTGYTFYHVPQTVEYGQYYFGTGEKELDLCFIL